MEEKNMKKRTMTRLFSMAAILLTGSAVLMSCEGKSSNRTGTPVVAAVVGTTTGYAYIDDSEELVGYNIDVLKAAFAKLPQYELSFTTTDFQSIFSGVDSGLYHIGAQAFISNAARREKYIYTESFGKYIFRIVTSADNTTIRSWRDLGGRVAESQVGDGPVAIIEAYNIDFPNNPIKLNFVENSDGTMYHLIDKKIDFEINSYTTALYKAREYGIVDQLKFVPFGDGAPKYFNTNQYFGFLISKTNPLLADDFNNALEELISDGAIAGLAEKWFGSVDFGVTLDEARAFKDPSFDDGK
jgi:polar amino acid transport system substrate-binding protein